MCDVFYITKPSYEFLQLIETNFDKNIEKELFLKHDFYIGELPFNNVIVFSIKLVDSNFKIKNKYALIYFSKLKGRLNFGRNLHYDFDIEHSFIIIHKDIICKFDNEFVYICEIWDKTKYVIVEHPDLRKTFIRKSDVLKFPYENSIKCFINETSDNYMFTKYTFEEFENISKIYENKYIDFNSVDYEQIAYYFSAPQYTLCGVSFIQENKNIMLFGIYDDFKKFENINGFIPFNIYLLTKAYYSNCDGEILLVDVPILFIVLNRVVFIENVDSVGDTSNVVYYNNNMNKFLKIDRNYKTKLKLNQITDINIVKENEIIRVYNDLENFIKYGTRCKNKFIIASLSLQYEGCEDEVDFVYDMNTTQNFSMDFILHILRHDDFIEENIQSYDDSYYIIKKEFSIEYPSLDKDRILNNIKELKLIEYVKKI